MTPARDAAEGLARVLDAELPSVTTIEALERFDLTRYLRETGTLEMPPAERLGWLAIDLERRAMGLAGPLRAWRAVDRIYEATLRLDRDAAEVWVSCAITAGEMIAGSAAETETARCASSRLCSSGTNRSPASPATCSSRTCGVTPATIYVQSSASASRRSRPRSAAAWIAMWRVRSRASAARRRRCELRPRASRRVATTRARPSRVRRARLEGSRAPEGTPGAEPDGRRARQT